MLSKLLFKARSLQAMRVERRAPRLYQNACHFFVVLIGMVLLSSALLVEPEAM